MEASPDLTLEAKRLYADATSLGMWRYTPCEAYDIELTRWWTYLIESNQFPTAFSSDLRPLSAFLRHFQDPTVAVFSTKNNRIWLAAWLRPFATNSGAFLSYWCLPSMRGTKTHARCAHIIYIFATALYPVIVGITRHEKLLRDHRLLGYNIVGQIPKFLEGEDAWIVYLTRQQFLTSAFSKRVYPRVTRSNQ